MAYGGLGTNHKLINQLAAEHNKNTKLEEDHKKAN